MQVDALIPLVDMECVQIGGLTVRAHEPRLNSQCPFQLLRQFLAALKGSAQNANAGDFRQIILLRRVCLQYAGERDSDRNTGRSPGIEGAFPFTPWRPKLPVALPEEVDRTGYQIQVEIRDRNQFGVRFARSALGRSPGPFGCFQFKHH